MKREVPLIITIVTGIMIVATFIIPHDPFASLQDRLTNWFIIVSGFTSVLGLDSLIQYHFLRIRDRRADRRYSVILLISFFVTFVLGIYSWIKHGSPLLPSSPNGWIFSNVLIPLQATMFALLAFFITSAAYRAFRIKTLESTLLLATACLVMIARVPIGNASWQGIAHLIGGAGADRLAQVPVLSAPTEWILSVPQMAAKRGISFGIALGSIAMSIRIILGIERTYLSS